LTAVLETVNPSASLQVTLEIVLLSTSHPVASHPSRFVSPTRTRLGCGSIHGASIVQAHFLRGVVQVRILVGAVAFWFRSGAVKFMFLWSNVKTISGAGSATGVP
jgi:hypothetical protein